MPRATARRRHHARAPGGRRRRLRRRRRVRRGSRRRPRRPPRTASRSAGNHGRHAVSDRARLGRGPPPRPAPPAATLDGVDGGPVAGDLGSFSWDGLVSDSPWIVERVGHRADPGTRLRVAFDGLARPGAWTARWAPIRRRQAGTPRAGGIGPGRADHHRGTERRRSLEPAAPGDVRRWPAGGLVLAGRGRWLTRARSGRRARLACLAGRRAGRLRRGRPPPTR